MKRYMPIIRTLLAVAVNVSLLAAIALPISSFLRPSPGPQTPWFAWLIAFCWQPVMGLQGILFFHWVDKRPLSELPVSFDRRARQSAIWGALLSIGLLFAYVGITHITGVATWRWNDGFAPTATLLAALITAMAGFGEEFFFRGYLLRTLGEYGPRVGLISSSLVFALMHMITGRVAPLDQLALFLHGLFFATLAQRTKSLWPGVITHFVYNFFTSVVWTGDPNTALLAFDGSLGWTKWAFKAAMVIPLFLMVWMLYRKTEKKQLQKASA